MLKTPMAGYAVFAAAVLLAASGCTYTRLSTPSSAGSTPTPPGSGAPTGTPSGAPSGTPMVTFQQVSQQILQPKCISCHSGSNAPNLTSYASFATNTAYIVPGNPSQSPLYQAVQSGAMPQGGPPLTQAELALIYDWIQEGAQND